MSVAAPNMEHADSSIWATKDNQFKTDGKLEGNWISFENKSHEIHFMEADHVAKDTTAKDVRQGLTSQKDPEVDPPRWVLLRRAVTRHQDGAPPRGRLRQYLLICFMPSEEQDGVPHAMMGMWHLVNAA